MAKPRPTINKRIREKAKHEKRLRKADRKADRDARREYERSRRTESGAQVDPDIADIKPGPQPPVWWDGSC
jgi:hypothetical protein